jgi:CheY-like chemotaxis protein
VDLRSVIHAAVDAVSPAFEAKNITFETAMDPEASAVSGDAHRLQQIFWNLFNNAVKFTPQGGTVRVEARPVDSCVEVSVTDSGIGISSEFLPYIFDRFRQADGSTTRMHGGLGLGLSIVKHLVQLHQGAVDVQSEGTDKGSTFTVSLPRETSVPLQPAENVVSPELGGNGLPAGFSKILEGLRILIVDDEVDSRELVSTILTRCGSEVNSCESVKEALKAFREWKPDLLVSDIGMPLEDGYDLIRKLRNQRSKRAKEIPAIALTAYATQEDRDRALAAGFQMHVAKPIEPEALVRSIASTVGRQI